MTHFLKDFMKLQWMFYVALQQFDGKFRKLLIRFKKLCLKVHVCIDDLFGTDILGEISYEIVGSEYLNANSKRINPNSESLNANSENLDYSGRLNVNSEYFRQHNQKFYLV